MKGNKLTLRWPSREPASMRGEAEESGPAMGDSVTQVTVFWKLESFRSRRPPPTMSHTFREFPPADTSREPAKQNKQHSWKHQNPIPHYFYGFGFCDRKARTLLLARVGVFGPFMACFIHFPTCNMEVATSPILTHESVKINQN